MILKNCLEHNTNIKKKRRNTGKAIFKDIKAEEFSRTEERYESSDQQCISGYLQIIQCTHT